MITWGTGKFHQKMSPMEAYLRKSYCANEKKSGKSEYLYLLKILIV